MRIQITQPTDWITAWLDAAKSSGMNFSEWIGECCNATLPDDVQLSERIGRGGDRRSADYIQNPPLNSPHI